MVHFVNKKLGSDITDPIGDMCSHSEKDRSLIVGYFTEDDAIFSEDLQWVCNECKEKIEAAHLEQEDECHDCKGVHKLKELKEWKWWDFSYYNGDNPLLICNNCSTKEPHIERVRNDKIAHDKAIEEEQGDWE